MGKSTISVGHFQVRKLLVYQAPHESGHFRNGDEAMDLATKNSGWTTRKCDWRIAIFSRQIIQLYI